MNYGELMDIDKRLIMPDNNEILRYMGWKSFDIKDAGAQDILSKIEHVKAELLTNIQPAYTYRRINVQKERLPLLIKGEAIKTFLCNAREAALVAVTLGHSYETYARSKSYTEGMVEQLIIEAAGTELIEKCADIVQEEMRIVQGAEKASRFSPGYEDFPIECQGELLVALEAQRIGIYYNAYNIMFPRKSITAVVKYEGDEKGCNNCSKACEYRQ